MSKRHWLLASVAALGLVAVQACSDSDNTPTYPGTAGSAGHTQGSGGAGHAGTGPVVAGATNENAGQAGESANEAGAAGAAGSSEAGAAGETNGGSGGTTNTFTLQATTLGQVIGTASGLSLYVLKTDTAATATDPPVTTCTGACLTNWPIYYGTPVSVPDGLLASDFGSYDRGGVLQSTYKGWPLYTYAPDTAVGDVKGEGLGSKWYTAKLPFTSPGATTFTLQTTTLGPVIATAGGLSLYVLTTDTVATATEPPVSTCTTAGCLMNWPIYYGTPVSVPLGLLASDFGSYDRGSGVLQSTYKGWPLYTYAPDTAVGDVKGEGSGNKWYTAKSPFVLP